MIFDCGKLRVGPLRPGMSRTEVRALLGAFSEFRKSESSENSTDDFQPVGVHAYYDALNIIKGAEIFRGNKVLVEDVDILSSDFRGALERLSKQGVRYKEIDSGVELVDFGVRLYVPDIYDVEKPSVEAVYVLLKE